jgi:hypothetical protein
MSTQHNESLAENANTNGHVDVEEVKPGFEFHIRVSRNVVIGAPIALLAGVVLGRKLGSLASKTAPVIHDAAEKVEEVAA